MAAQTRPVLLLLPALLALSACNKDTSEADATAAAPVRGKVVVMTLGPGRAGKVKVLAKAGAAAAIFMAPATISEAMDHGGLDWEVALIPMRTAEHPPCPVDVT